MRFSLYLLDGMLHVPSLQTRAKFAGQYALRHLCVSVLVAALAAGLVFGLWYPSPTAQLLEVGHIYAVLLVVDIVCGPLLTLVLASPAKPRREMWTDFGLVGLLQLGALLYGLYALEGARPVAYVFEQDRLVLVGKNELYIAQTCQPERSCKRPALGLWGINWQIAEIDKDRFRSLDLSLQGVSPAMRYEAWIDWSWSRPQLQNALKPLSALRDDQQEKLRALQGAECLQSSKFRYLPLVSSKTLDWIAVFNAQGAWVAAFPVDGFQ